MTDPRTDEPAAVWFAPPDGYTALPLHDVAATVLVTKQLIDEVGTAAQRAISGMALGTLQVFLEQLAERDAVYCGIGRHLSPDDGSPVTSSLVVTLSTFPGRRNPRLLLKDLAEGKRRAGERGRLDITDLPNGPVMFFERVLSLPAAPDLGQHVLATETQSPVWQLEAYVPSPDGDHLAAIEVSTPFVAAGPAFRPMTVQLAASVSFRAPDDTDPFAVLEGRPVLPTM